MRELQKIYGCLLRQAKSEDDDDDKEGGGVGGSNNNNNNGETSCSNSCNTWAAQSRPTSHFFSHFFLSFFIFFFFFPFLTWTSLGAAASVPLEGKSATRTEPRYRE